MKEETALHLEAAHHKRARMRSLTKYGGIAASIILIAFGIGSVVTGLNGRSEVRNTLASERIVGTPDMDPAIANKPIDTGAKAKLFAKGMRKHTLAATGGQLYSQMGQFLTADGKPTSDEKLAAIDPQTKKPVANAARNIWVTETALGTALNTSFFAENVAKFAIVMGFAMLLIGTGFLVMVFRLPWESAVATEARKTPRPAAKPSIA
jgi:hypothetical protein